MRRASLLVFLAVMACDNRGLQKVSPRLSVPASPIDFGTLPVLNTKRIEIELVNVGRAKLTASNIALTDGDGIFRIESKPAEIEAGATEKVVVAFAPQEERTYQNTLVIDSDDEDEPHLELVLTGTGSTRGVIVVRPSSVDFGRVAECGSSIQLVTVSSQGTADLIIEEIAFTETSASAFTFVGSTRTPVTVAIGGEIQLTVRVSAAAMTEGTLSGGIRIRSTDPEQREVVVPLTATVNRAPVASIAMLGNGAPGQRIALDGSGSMDPDGDTPLSYKWTLRSKPLASMTSIAMPTAATTEMTLDPMVPGAYEVQLDVTDSTGAKSCQPARATVVASPAQKLMVEMFWDNAGTDLDLHVRRSPQSVLFSLPDDCYYQNRFPDWGVMGDANDDPGLVRDALTGYGPEVFGYVNPVDGTYRIAAVFENDLLNPSPSSRVTVRVYLFGVLKAEATRTLETKGTVWEAFDVTWPSGDLVVLP